MELLQTLQPWWRTADDAGQPLQHRSEGTNVYARPSTSSPPTFVAVQHVSRQPDALLQEFFSFTSSIPINSRTSLEAMLRGTRIRMGEMRLKMKHKFISLPMREKTMAHLGQIGLTAATDLSRRHLLTLESTLGSDAERQSVSTFISSRFESKLSWGLAAFKKIHGTSFFSRYNCKDDARNQIILQIVHKMNERTSLSPIVSMTSGSHLQVGMDLTSLFGKTSLQVRGFRSGNGAYSFNIKAQAGKID